MGRETANNWQQALADWARLQLTQPQPNLLSEALPAFEKVMISAALQHAHGRKGEAAKLLGWGRNTLTRKLKELAET